MEEKRRSGKGCLIAVLVIETIVIVFLLMVISGMSMVSAEKKKDIAVDEHPEMDEAWSCGSGTTKVVRISVTGLIMLGEEIGILGSVPNSSEVALKSIRRATQDKEVKAIVLEIDSGGGGVTASDIIYNELLKFKEKDPGRKVVALFGDVAASGAYYIASAADCIIAHPTGITGSIGVIMQTFNLKGLGEKMGVTNITIKTGSNKDLMNPFEDVSDEQKAILQGVVDNMFDRFVSIVAKGRKMTNEQVLPLADGRIYSADEALKLGLVDAIGYWEDAVKKTSELLGVEDVKIFKYGETFSLISFLTGAKKSNPVPKIIDDVSKIRFMYRWEM